VIAGVVVLIALVVWWTQRGGSSDPTTEEDRTEVATGSAGGASRVTKRVPSTKRPGVKIAGIVLRDGVPVPGATVSLIRASANRALHQVKTDASGHFELGEYAAERYTVVAEKPGTTHGRAFVDLRDVIAKPAPDQLRLVLHACDAALHGFIRDASGGPVAKARIGPSPGGQGIESDDNGAYEICVPVGDGAVWVDADGYARVRETIVAYGRVRRDFELVPEAVVTGRVVRANDKTPVPGAEVALMSDRTMMGDGWMWESTTADDDGQFRIDGLLPGRYTVTAKADRLATREPVRVLAEVGTPAQATCEVEPTLVIAGKLVEKGTTTPIPGAQIRVFSRLLSQGEPETARTQPDGSFELEHLFPATYRVDVYEYRLRDVTITLGTEDKRDVVIEVEARSTLAGRVTLRGQPVDGALVRGNGSGNPVTTDADGNYLLRLEPGEQAIYAESKRLGAFATDKKVTLAKSEQRAGFDIELDLAGAIEGTVVDQTGKPVGGVALEFSLISGRDFGAATTAEDGTFKVGALSGGGSYGYLVRSLDGSLKFPPALGKRFPPIAVADGKTRVTGVRIAIRYERKAIAGRVQTTKGAPLPDVLVRAEAKRSWGAATARTTVDGTFTFRDLPDGTYTVRATGTRGTTFVENVAAGRRDVVLSIPEPGTIAGTVTGFSGQVVVMAYSATARAELRASAKDGAFELRNVPPGEYNVVAIAGDEHATVEATVAEGATATVKLVVRASGSVTGTAVDETGAPVANARCNLNGGNNLTADATGTVRIAKASVGAHRMWCSHADRNLFGREDVEVQANQNATVRVTLKAQVETKKGVVGFRATSQLEETVVSAVTPGGPADRAGLQVGDVLVKYNDEEAEPGLEELLAELGPGTTVKLTIERNDKPQVLTLTVGP